MSISTRLEQFPIFCRPDCGQAIVDAWQSCNVFDEIEQFGNLLIGMCASNEEGDVCYTAYNELIQYLNTATTCGAALAPVGAMCSTQCRDATREIVDDYGCCVNVPLLFDSNGSEAFARVFFRCGVTRPGVCTTNAFFNLPPQPTLPPSEPSQPPSGPSQPPSGPSQPPSGPSQPAPAGSNAVRHVTTLLPVAVVCLITAILM